MRPKLICPLSSRQGAVHCPLIHRLCILCVWLFNDGYLQIFYINQCFLFAFRAVKWIVIQNCIFSNSVTDLTATNWAAYPFCFHSSLHPYLELFLVDNWNTNSNAYYTHSSSNNDSFYICVYSLHSNQKRISIHQHSR